MILYAIAMAGLGLVGGLLGVWADIGFASGAAVAVPFGIAAAYALARPFGPDQDGAHE